MTGTGVHEDQERRKPATIRDVAARAGVSVATVSNVLRGRKASSAEVAARVRAAAAALAYQADRAAAQLRTGQTDIVAVIVPSLDNPFFTALVAVIEQCARRSRHEIIVASAGNEPETEATRLRALLSWRPAGIIILPCTDAFETQPMLAAAHLPYVVLDRLPANAGADCIGTENADAAAAATAHLATLGHRRILVAASSLALANIRERWDGVLRACAARDLPAPAVLELGLGFDTAAASLSGWLARHARPSAIIALTNFTTLGVLAFLREQGLNVPRDVSLVGYDDYAWMQAATPPVTAVRQPVEQMAEQAWACLLRRIGGASGPREEIRLACSLQVRDSTAPPPREPPTKGRKR